MFSRYCSGVAGKRVSPTARLGGCLALALFLASGLVAQTFGEIAGEVKDSSGALITTAVVTATNLGTSAVRTTTTNDAGLYSFAALPPGMYSVKVEAQGFRPIVRSEVQLQVQQTARIAFTMEAGTIEEVVQVTGAAPMLNTEDVTIGTVIDNRRIVELPLNGRNFLQLVALSPNVTFGFAMPGQTSGRQGGTRAAQNMSLSGMRGTWNHYTLDGIENTDVNFNLYVMLPSIDALSEFKVQSGIYPGEFGRGAGQINVSTKSGANQYHGTLFEFLRNDKLDSRAYDFLPARPRKNPFKWNQFGFTLGGPVSIPKLFEGRNRLFFMSNFEGYRERKHLQAIYTTPTVAMRNGDFSYALPGNPLYDPKSKARVNGQLTGEIFPNNQIPKSRMHPASLKMLEFWPEPNMATPVVRDNFRVDQGRSINKDQFTQRIDWNESASSQWFGRYSWTDEFTLTPALKLNGTTLYSRARQYALSNTRVLSASQVNEFRFGVNDFRNLIGLELAGKRNVVQELGIPGLSTPDPLTWGAPRVTQLVNVSAFGADSSGPFAMNDAVFQAIDNFAWVKGRHSLKFGGEVRRDRFNQLGNEFARGSFEFSGQATNDPFTRRGGDSTADLLLGQASKAEAAIALAFSQFRATSFAVYGGDVWRISPKVTLDFGLRWEVVQPWLDRSGNETNVFSPYLSNAANVADMNLHPVMLRTGSGDFYEGKVFRYPGVQVARDGRLGERLMKTDSNNFAPRLGVAYSPSLKWSIRTGAGLFYSTESNNSRFDLNRNMGGRVSRTANPELPDLTYDNFMTSASFPWTLPPAPFVWGVKPNLASAYSLQYLLNVQRQLDGQTVLEVGYLGSQSRRLHGLQNTNAPMPAASGSYASRAPFPEFGIIQTVHSEGTANYNSLSTKVSRRMAAGLTYLASHTWSKAIDTTSAVRGTSVDIFPQNSRCLACDRGYSAFNTPHRFVASVMYELPVGKGKAWLNHGGVWNQMLGGWQLGSIFTIQSGRPINTQAGFDAPNTSGYGEIRLNATGQDPYLSGDARGTERWFNTGAFTPPDAGGFGNVSRNRLIGPSERSWDFSSLKNFQVAEGRQVQFRFEAFNFPNHPNFGSPVANWGSRDPAKPGPSFGVIRSCGTMRELQFGLKFVF